MKNYEKKLSKIRTSVYPWLYCYLTKYFFDLVSEFVIFKLDTLTSQMPINIISEEAKNLITDSQPKVPDKAEKNSFFKRQSSKSMLSSSTSSSSLKAQAKASNVKNGKPLRQQRLESSPEAKMKIKEHTTPRQGLKKIGLSAAKKRSALQSGLLQGNEEDMTFEESSSKPDAKNGGTQENVTRGREFNGPRSSRRTSYKRNRS